MGLFDDYDMPTPARVVKKRADFGKIISPAPRIKKWRLEVNRDNVGMIESVDAYPVYDERED